MSSNLDVGPFSGGNIAIYQDVQSSGVAGTSITTSIVDQPFNTDVITKSWASRSGNEITLDAGDYMIYLVDSVSWSVLGDDITLFITTAANATLDKIDGKMGTLTNIASPQIYTFAFSLSVSTAIKYRALKQSASGGTVTRKARSQGDEHYQKLIIQKIG